MAISIVDVKGNDREVVVTLRSELQEELNGLEARQEAIKAAAASGVTRPGISSGEPAHPVDANGQCTQDVMMGRTPVAAYQRDIRVVSGTP